MKTLLTAFNAKYIHSSLAIRSLASYVKSCFPVDICEFTINQNLDDVLAELYQHHPDLIGFSCYIFNVDIVLKIVTSLKKILPNCRVLLGGPEASYRAQELMKSYHEIDFIISGEGELPFFELLQQLEKKTPVFKQVSSLTYRNSEKILQNPMMATNNRCMAMYHYSEQEIKSLQNKIIYFESSRGCPFRCSYCMSSIDKTVSYFSLSEVEQQLRLFLECRVPQVKFVDRTFNCHPQRALYLWNFIKENDNGVTNFHFEIAADLLTQDEIALIQDMRPGLIQLEIGVQSTNTHTLSLINRNTNLHRLFSNVKELQKNNNVHLHLDLIAGLPEEDIVSFGQSFDDVYRAHPHQLQLGFLKVLQGTPLFQEATAYGIIYREYPPYEVLKTSALSYLDLCKLKQIEEMVDLYYNSGRFRCCLTLLEKKKTSPFHLFYELAMLCNQKRTDQRAFGKFELYQLMLEFAIDAGIDENRIKQAIKFDLFHRERLQILPSFLHLSITKQNNEKIIEMKKSHGIPFGCHLEHFYDFFCETDEKKELWVAFDYNQKDLYGNALIKMI